MATEQALRSVSIPAGADLTGSMFLVVDIATDNSGVKLVTGAGARGIGVLQNKPNVGDPAQVAIDGITKVIVGVGDVATAGLALQADAAGKVIAAAAGDYVVGYSLDPGVAGNVIRMLLGSRHLTA